MSKHTPDPCLNWPLAAYGKIIRGNESTSEDQVAEACSPEMASRFVACVNALQGVPTERLEKAAELGITDVSMGNLFSSRLALQQEIAEMTEQLEAQQTLNGGLQSESNTLAARAVSRVEELQLAVKGRLAAEQESDQWERRACNEATRARDLELLNGELLVALEGLIKASNGYDATATQVGCAWNQAIIVVKKAKAAKAGGGV